MNSSPRPCSPTTRMRLPSSGSPCPHRRLHHVMDIGAEGGIVADFVFAEAFFEPAHADQADAARMAAFADIGGVDGAGQAFVIGLERLFEPAQMRIGVAEIVPGPREAGIEPDRLAIEDEAFLGRGPLRPARSPANSIAPLPSACDRWRRAAFRSQSSDRPCRTGCCRDCCIRAANPGSARCIGGTCRPHRHVIFRFQAVRPRLSRRSGSSGSSAKAFSIGDERLVQMAHLLERHRQNMIGLGIARRRPRCRAAPAGRRAPRRRGAMPSSRAAPARSICAAPRRHRAPRPSASIFARVWALRADAGQRLRIRVGLLLAP